jgi:Helix-turn-helix domain/Phage derived protein Gp49-like (DUF891)
MKELRFEAANGEWRVAFAFDPKRNAILLVAGDKSAGARSASTSSLLPRRISGSQRIWAAQEPERRRTEMGRNLNEIIAELPPERQERIEARYQELRQQVESLRELRQIAGKAQLDIATSLNIKQPSVSKIEKQTDMYLSTLRSYVEAIGGELELVVKLPKRPALRLHQLGDALHASDDGKVAGKRRRKRSS